MLFRNIITSEISNLSTYIVYHNIKKITIKKIKLSKIQKYTYGLFRVPLMTYFLYKNIVNKNVDKVPYIYDSCIFYGFILYKTLIL